MIKIIECPRDAMQGIPFFIPTEQKAAYINALLKVGFHTIDFGSFVSHRTIPQMRDTAEVLSKLDLSSTKSKLLAIIPNEKGAKAACEFEEIDYLGYPHSVSPTFLKKNINSTIEKSLDTIDRLLEACDKHNKELVVYLSMGFGNPYGDEWSVSIMEDAVSILQKKNIKIIPLSDTTGVSTKENITALFSKLVPMFPDIEFGFHLHTSIHNWFEQIDAAYSNGCRRFDTVMLGLGGCPMAEDDLVGNMKTVEMLEYFQKKDITLNIDKKAFEAAYIISLQTFKNYLP